MALLVFSTLHAACFKQALDMNDAVLIFYYEKDKNAKRVFFFFGLFV